MVWVFLVVMVPFALVVGGAFTLIQSGRAGQSILPALLCLMGGPVLFVVAGTLTGLHVSPLGWWEMIQHFLPSWGR